VWLTDPMDLRCGSQIRWISGVGQRSDGSQVWVTDTMGPPKINPIKDQCHALVSKGTRQYYVLHGILYLWGTLLYCDWYRSVDPLFIDFGCGEHSLSESAFIYSSYLVSQLSESYQHVVQDTVLRVFYLGLRLV
jgi:hypothetical protein